MKTTLLILSLFTFLTSCNRNDGAYDSRRTDSRSGYQQTTNKNDQDRDWEITRRVKAALADDNSLSDSGRYVGVDTTDGVVTLTGNVYSKDESRYIERKVKAVQGVRRVDNQLIVNP